MKLADRQVYSLFLQQKSWTNSEIMPEVLERLLFLDYATSHQE